jgi:hypothetical protein
VKPACTYDCPKEVKICPDGITEVWRDYTRKDCHFHKCCECGYPCKMASGEEGVC